MLVYRGVLQCCRVFSLISDSVFSFSSFRQQQATVLFRVCEGCDVFMEPFVLMNLMSNGAFYCCVCAICVCVRACVLPTDCEYWLLLFIIYIIIFAVLYQLKTWLTPDAICVYLANVPTCSLFSLCEICCENFVLLTYADVESFPVINNLLLLCRIRLNFQGNRQSYWNIESP